LNQQVSIAFVSFCFDQSISMVLTHLLYHYLRKLADIKNISAGILATERTDDSILKVGNQCDQLLQEFYRFDEGLSVKGKWQGGSVTGVCRGWGTSKVSTDASILFTFAIWEELIYHACIFSSCLLNQYIRYQILF